MARLGEDVTEVLDYIPGRFRVIRHVRPKYACRRCDAITQAPAPSMPTPRGRAAPGMLAHLLVSKYCDHLPLYRQSEIYARDGLDLDRSTLSDWVGQAVWLLQPIVDGIRNHVFAAEKVHADDTPVPVLEPGLGRTRTGRLWVYVRDDRPFCGPAPPAAVYFYSPDRGGEHPAAHLAHFTGFLQADAYSGFAALYEPRKAGPGLPMMPAITEVACWAHCRRSIFDVWQSTKSTVAKAALDRIAQFYAIEDKARFAPPDERLAHRTAIIPLLDAFFTWAQTAERKLSARSELAQALRYIIKRRTALTRFATDARLEADNNIAENAIRCIALGRRNWLFAGSHSGGERAAAMYSILQTAKFNGVNPEAYLTDTSRKDRRRASNQPHLRTDALGLPVDPRGPPPNHARHRTLTLPLYGARPHRRLRNSTNRCIVVSRRATSSSAGWATTKRKIDEGAKAASVPTSYHEHIGCGGRRGNHHTADNHPARERSPPCREHDEYRAAPLRSRAHRNHGQVEWARPLSDSKSHLLKETLPNFTHRTRALSSAGG